MVPGRFGQLGIPGQGHYRIVGEFSPLKTGCPETVDIDSELTSTPCRVPVDGSADIDRFHPGDTRCRDVCGGSLAGEQSERYDEE